MKSIKLFVMAGLGNVLPVCNWQGLVTTDTPASSSAILPARAPSAGSKPAARWACALALLLVLPLQIHAADALTERLQRGLFEEEANRNVDAAIQEYQAVVTQSDEQRKVTATALFRLGECYRKLGKTNEAAAFYQRITRDFSEQEQLAKLSRDYLGGTVAANPPLAKVAADMTQAEAEELARVKTLARNSPDLLNAPARGLTELQNAARGGHYSVAEFLLSQGVKPNDPTQGDSPLIEAAQRGHLRIVQLLLDQGATKDDASRALIHACRSGFKSVAELLIARGANVNPPASMGLSPLYYATSGRQIGLVELLLSHGAKPDMLADTSITYLLPNNKINTVARGTTPLHEAASRGLLPIAELLLKAGADARATNYEAMTPLHFAANAGHSNLCALLLDRGADVNAPDAAGMTPFTQAVGQKHTELVRWFLQHGANPDQTITSPVYPPNALELALFTSSTEVLSALLAVRPKLEIKNRDNLTALQNAVRNRQDALAILLLEAGANPNGSYNIDGYTPLHLAVDGRTNLVAALLKNGADPNVVTRQAQTPLSMTLAKAGRQVAVPGPGAPAPRPGSPFGQPTITATEAASYQQIVELLRAYGADEFLQRRGFISAVRGPQQRETIFSKGTNDLNRYTLMEFLAAVYQTSGSDFSFPDFAKITIRRLVNQREEIIPVNAATMLATTNCQGDVPLEWGDDIEIPLRDHPVSDTWPGLGDGRGKGLETCLRRSIRLVVGGTNVSVVMLPYLHDTRSGAALSSSSRQPFFRLAATVLRDNRFRNLLRSSSDLSRVTVTRTDPQTKETKKMTFDLNAVALPDMSYSGTPPPIPWAHDLWLRDGDVIEVPEKP